MRIIAVLLLLLLLTSSVFHTSGNGPIILCGGGKVPERAITLFKSLGKQGRNIVVSCSDVCHDRWRESLNPIFLLPEELGDIPVSEIGSLLIEGGNQYDYVCRLDGQYLQKIHEAGIPILTTSAGTMIVAQHFFSAEQDTITSAQAESGERVCLGRDLVNIKWLKDMIIDTHFTSRNRLGRLKVFMEKSGANVGIGIDEETAIYIDDYHFSTIGEGKVTILRKNDAS